jgi:hypothetical protein
VYLNPTGTYTFTMKDSIVIAPNNDVYLEGIWDDAVGKITIGSALTGTPPVATITVPDASYADDTTVLLGAVTGNYGKFAVTPKAGVRWYVDSDGELTLAP